MLKVMKINLNGFNGSFIHSSVIVFVLVMFSNYVLRVHIRLMNQMGMRT